MKKMRLTLPMTVKMATKNWQWTMTEIDYGHWTYVRVLPYKKKLSLPWFCKTLS